ncbi:hypothetical protein J6590_034068 [Homalodisca vitripennis]|nr:hypothetical protein J6590_034068 [Homalodisca vitripennis]
MAEVDGPPANISDVSHFSQIFPTSRHHYDCVTVGRARCSPSELSSSVGCQIISSVRRRNRDRRVFHALFTLRIDLSRPPGDVLCENVNASPLTR